MGQGRVREILRVWALVLVGALLAVTPSLVFGQSYLQVKGSDTMVNLVQRLSEVYMEGHKGASLAVTGGGSGTGIAALINGKVDIADASRSIKDKEVQKAKERGISPVGFVIAMDGLSVITHESNPAEFLTVDQVGRIFKGEITNWKQLGGPDLAISMYGRQSNSGTFVYFRDHVLKGDYSAKVKRMNGNAQIVEAVRRDKGGIGYVGIGYVKDTETGRVVKGLKPLMIRKGPGAPAASPLDPEAVRSGAYPIARPLFQYTNGTPKGAIADFIKWETGEEGQKVAVEMGFYPITVTYAEENAKKLGNKTAAR